MVSLFENIKSENKICPIIIENEEISDFSKKIFGCTEGRKYLVVISQKVEKLYGKTLNIPKENKFILKDGEKQKDWAEDGAASWQHWSTLWPLSHGV